MVGKFDEKVLIPPLQGTFIFSVAIYKPLKFNKTYIYPTWAYALGWFLGLFCVLVVPLWVIFKLVQMKGTVWQVCILTNTSKIQSFASKVPLGVTTPDSYSSEWGGVVFVFSEWLQRDN